MVLVSEPYNILLTEIKEISLKLINNMSSKDAIKTMHKIKLALTMIPRSFPILLGCTVFLTD